jgi:hypothetical protein
MMTQVHQGKKEEPHIMLCELQLHDPYHCTSLHTSPGLSSFDAFSSYVRHHQKEPLGELALEVAQNGWKRNFETNLSQLQDFAKLI